MARHDASRSRGGAPPLFEVIDAGDTVVRDADEVRRMLGATLPLDHLEPGASLATSVPAAPRAVQVRRVRDEDVAAERALRAALDAFHSTVAPRGSSPGATASPRAAARFEAAAREFVRSLAPGAAPPAREASRIIRPLRPMNAGTYEHYDMSSETFVWLCLALGLEVDVRSWCAFGGDERWAVLSTEGLFTGVGDGDELAHADDDATILRAVTWLKGSSGRPPAR